MKHLIKLVYKEWMEVKITEDNLQYEGQVLRGLCYFVGEILVCSQKINKEQSKVILRFLKAKATQLQGIKEYDMYWFPMYSIEPHITPKEAYKHRKEFLEKILKK